MAINLITGQPRNGKSQRAIAIILDKLVKENDELEKEGKERRKIYTDIDGINSQGVKTFIHDCITIFEQDKIWFGEHDDSDKPDDFWCPPYNSIFFFDECHKREWVRESSGTVSKNPTTVSLNEHGHAGHDIYLLTQFPAYIHTHIRGLIQEHWHVKRIVGMRRAFVYKWDEFTLNPRAKSAMSEAYERQIFKFKKKYEDAYKSASAHSKISVKVPAKLFIPAIAIIVIILLLARSLTDNDNMFGQRLGITEQQQVEAEKKIAEQQQQMSDMQSQQQQQLEQIKDLKIELEKLKTEYLPKHITVLADHEEVRPAMVITANGQCQAFNKYGEPLLITDSLCQQMSDHPSLMPRSRSRNVVTADSSVSMPISSSSTNSHPQATNVQYFDHTKDFANGNK